MLFEAGTSLVESEDLDSQLFSCVEERIFDSVKAAPFTKECLLALNGNVSLLCLDDEEGPNSLKEVHRLSASNGPKVDWLAMGAVDVQPRLVDASTEIPLPCFEQFEISVCDPHKDAVVQVAISSTSDVSDRDLPFTVENTSPISSRSFHQGVLQYGI